MTQPFTHLRAHTEYSIVDSTLRVSELLARAKADGQPSAPMTDMDGLFGAIRFYEAARKDGVKPIVGVDIQIELEAGQAPLDEEGNPVVPNPNAQPARRALLLSKDYEGYLKLMRLISKAYTTNLVDGKPVIKESWLRDEGSQGLFCLSGSEKGHLGAPALAGDYAKAAENAGRLKNIFGSNFFVEVQRRGAPTDGPFVDAVVEIAREIDVPLVATHPIQFSTQDDYVVHELKVCDARKEIIHDRNRTREFTPYQHFLTTAEMEELFSDLPDALANARAIAQACSTTIPLGKPVLPDFATEDGSSLTDAFAKVSREGLVKRMAKLYPNEAERSAKQAEYSDRLEYEIGVIKEMKFEGYFMIVHDFIDWAHRHEIPVGPGRGSGAGSLVAYSLGITDLDPLKYNLLFERFLNPDRVSMPDFDIDFCVERRELVIEYVTNKYGSEAVAGITALGTLAARAAVKAAGRALGMPPMMVQGVSNLIPNKPGSEVSIADAIESVPEVIERYDSEPEVKRLLDHANTLEGLPKSVGKHAAGVVIARGRIADYSPVYVPEGETKVTTQYDKDDLEKAGLVKFDFLGLKNLTMIDKAVGIIRKTPGQEGFDLSQIPLDDAEVYKMLQQGDTQAVFQFESEFMRKLLLDVQPQQFDDIIAVSALGRPGPMDLIPEYVRNKAAPNSIQYADPRMKPILQETYGVMVYQEQVMRVAQVIGGYSLGGADLLRRAMGKKKAEEMAEHRKIFEAGAALNGVSAVDANKIFSHMEKFAGYGFNKSHAAAYGVLSYQTAYLKKRHPAAYFTAVLSVESVEDIDKVPSLIANAQSKGISVLAPDINLSEANFSSILDQPNTLRYGLAGLKGIGQDAVRQVLNARRSFGAFESLEDFMVKCSKSIPPMGVNLVNKTVVERLIMSGCFDALHPKRAESLAAYPVIAKYNSDVNKREAKLEKRKTDNALADLFTLSGVAPAAPKGKKKAEPKPIAQVERYEWPQVDGEQPLMERLENEKKAFGFYFSGHPMTHFREQLGGLKAAETIAQLQEAFPSYDDLHLVGGVVSDTKEFDTKNGKMVKATISDGLDSTEIIAFADAYAPVKSWFKKDAFALFTFQVKEDKMRGGNSFSATEIRNFADAQTYLAQRLNVSIAPESVERLREIVSANPGDLPIGLWHPKDGTHVPGADQTLRIGLTMPLLDQLKQEFGKNVKIAYPKEQLAIKAPPRPKKAWNNRR
jgi:DNA polymerase-3 subunit alpha